MIPPFFGSKNVNANDNLFAANDNFVVAAEDTAEAAAEDTAEAA
jgi:hypothetical protein